MNTVTPRVFIAATRQNDGKTTTSLGLIAALQQFYPRIGYIKPVGQRFIQIEEQKIDEDTVLMDRVYRLNCPLVDMSPIAVEPDFTRKYLQSANYDALVRKIQNAFDRVAWEKDFVLCEGSGHAGVGSVFDLSNARVARLVGAKVIIVTQGGIGKPIDEVALNQALFEKEGVEIIGVILNKVLGRKIDYISDFARRGLKRQGLELLGVIPHQPILSNPTLGLIREELHAEALNDADQYHNLVDEVVVGAMGVHHALNFFRKGVLLITPGDREDIILAVSTTLLDRRSEGLAGIVLTGNLRPGESALKIIRDMPFPVLLAREDSYAVASQVHDLTVKTRPNDTEKIELIRNLIAKHVDVNTILKALMSTPLPLNPALQHLPVYQPGRPIEEVARELGLPPESIIKLASNENPLGPSPAALAAMQKVLANLHLYPDGNAFYLKRALAEKLGVEPENLILGNGSNEIIEFVGHALMRPGADVVVSQFCFAVYPIVTHLFGATLVSVPAKDYGHDLPAMLQAITPNTKVIFVANPNNPTGTLAPRADVVRLVNDVPDNVLLVMDEAYIDFLAEPVDLVPLVRNGLKPNLLLMRTFSKIFGLAGLRLGYGIGHPELVASLEKIRQPFNINSIAQAGALAALDDKEHLARTRANNALGLDYLQNTFRQLGLPFVPSHANFVLVRVGDGRRVFEELQKRGFITRLMASYQLPEWIRITVGTPEENARCVAALRSVLAAIEN